MTITRHTAYCLDEPHEVTPHWDCVRFTEVKIKGRKVLKLYGLDELFAVSIFQEDDPTGEAFAESWYSVHYHGYNEEEGAFILEIVATLNNKTISRHRSSITLHVIAHVCNGNLGLKEYKGDVPVTEPCPRVPKKSTYEVSDLASGDTMDKAMQSRKNPLAFLDALA